MIWRKTTSPSSFLGPAVPTSQHWCRLRSLRSCYKQMWELTFTLTNLFLASIFWDSDDTWGNYKQSFDFPTLLHNAVFRHGRWWGALLTITWPGSSQGWSVCPQGSRFQKIALSGFLWMILKVSKPARLAAAGGLVFLVYLLYCYHKLPREGGDGGGGEVVDQNEEEDSGLPVMPAKQVLLIW